MGGGGVARCRKAEVGLGGVGGGVVIGRGPETEERPPSSARRLPVHLDPRQAD